MAGGRDPRGVLKGGALAPNLKCLTFNFSGTVLAVGVKLVRLIALAQGKGLKNLGDSTL